MEKFVLCCGSAVDLQKEHLDERNIKYVPFTYFIDEVEYKDDFGKTIPFKKFYNKIREGAITKTSQINEFEYIEFFEKYLQEGFDIVCVCLSSGISGTYLQAVRAKIELREKYPNNQIYVIDSLGASSGYGLLMDILADYRDKGYDAEKIVELAEGWKKKVNHLFFSTDLTTYVRGGRISKASGFLGSLLRICPILHVDPEGKLVQYKKVRTKAKVIEQMVIEMEKLCDGGINYNDKCYISHSDSLEDANILKNKLEQQFPNIKGKIVINEIGTIIGSHSGPGTVALFFLGKER